MAHLNINQIIGKYNALKEIIQGYLDILAISESKLDQSNPTNVFDMKGYTQPFRRDRNKNGGGILVYVREGIPCRELKVKSGAENLEGIFIEINLRKTKWLLFAGYNNCKINIGAFLHTVDHYMCNLENFILLGDFNSEVQENEMKEFCDSYNLKNLVKEATCSKIR